MLGKECRCKVPQVGQQGILLIRPVRCEFKGVAVGFLLSWPASCFLLLGIACGVRVVFRFSTIRNHKNLHKVEHSPACPERISQIAVYLVEGFLDVYASAFQFYVYQWQAIYENGYVIAIFMHTVFHLILVNDLQAVVIDVMFVDELDVFRQAVIHFQRQHIALALNHFGFVLNGHLLIRNHRQQAHPFRFAQRHVVQQFQLSAHVHQQPCLVLHLHILIPLRLQLLDESRLQLCLALIALGILLWDVVVRHHRRVLLLYYDFIVVCHHLLLPILPIIPPKNAKGRLNKKDNAKSPAEFMKPLKTLKLFDVS